MKLIKKNKETIAAFGVVLEASASGLTQGGKGCQTEGWTNTTYHWG